MGDINWWVVLVALFVVSLVITLVRAHFKKDSPVSLLDLVTKDGKLSTTSILQLVGGFVGTWVMVKTTIAGGLSWDLFACYLAYVASVDGFSKVITAKYGAGHNYTGYSSPYSRRYQPDSAEDMGRAKTPIEGDQP